jgi:hypothetical protein
VAIGTLITVCAAFYGIGCGGWIDGVSITVATASSVLALVRGYKDWTSWKNIIHFWPAIAGAVIVSALQGTPEWFVAYSFFALLAGAVDPMGHRLGLPDYHRVSECVAGALLIGGLAFI